MVANSKSIETKATVGLAISHIARVGIVVAHAVAFEFREQFLHAFVIDAFHARSATGGDDAQFRPGRLRAGAAQIRTVVAPDIEALALH